MLSTAKTCSPTAGSSMAEPERAGARAAGAAAELASRRRPAAGLAEEPCRPRRRRRRRCKSRCSSCTARPPAAASAPAPAPGSRSLETTEPGRGCTRTRANPDVSGRGLAGPLLGVRGRPRPGLAQPGLPEARGLGGGRGGGVVEEGRGRGPEEEGVGEVQGEGS